jgi:hypothetical protein
METVLSEGRGVHLSLRIFMEAVHLQRQHPGRITGVDNEKTEVE